MVKMNQIKYLWLRGLIQLYITKKKCHENEMNSNNVSTNKFLYVKLPYLLYLGQRPLTIIV